MPPFTLCGTFAAFLLGGVLLGMWIKSRGAAVSKEVKKVEPVSEPPPALDPARAEAIRAEIAWRLDGKMTQAEAGYYRRGINGAMK